MNGVVIDEMPRFLALNPSENMHVIDVCHPFDANHLMIIPLSITIVTSYKDMKKLTQEVYKDTVIPEIYLTAEASPWELSGSEFLQMEQSMLVYQR